MRPFTNRIDEVGLGPMMREEHIHFPTYDLINQKGKVVLEVIVNETVRFGGSIPFRWTGIQRKSIKVMVFGRRKNKNHLLGKPLFSVNFDPYWPFLWAVCPFNGGKFVSSTGRHMGKFEHFHPPGGHLQWRITDQRDRLLFTVLIGKTRCAHPIWIDPNILVLKPRQQDRVHVQVANIRRAHDLTLVCAQMMKPKQKGKSIRFRGTCFT
jgi:hypothetical protein